jgi:hypothetical protein
MVMAVAFGITDAGFALATGMAGIRIIEERAATFWAA